LNRWDVEVVREPNASLEYDSVSVHKFAQALRILDPVNDNSLIALVLPGMFSAPLQCVDQDADEFVEEQTRSLVCTEHSQSALPEPCKSPEKLIIVFAKENENEHFKSREESEKKTSSMYASCLNIS
jgi:hypothetical protein